MTDEEIVAARVAAKLADEFYDGQRVVVDASALFNTRKENGTVISTKAVHSTDRVVVRLDRGPIHYPLRWKVMPL
jgi:hypothetical protein